MEKNNWFDSKILEVFGNNSCAKLFFAQSRIIFVTEFVTGFKVVSVAGFKSVFVTTFRVTQFRVIHFTSKVKSYFSQLAQYDFDAGFRVVCILV